MNHALLIGLIPQATPLQLTLLPPPPFSAPPSAPSRTYEVITTQHTAFFHWDPPMYDGGRSDLFYNIMLEDGNLTTVNPWPINGTNYTLTGLTPYTIYYVFVVAENGVSSFADRILSRAVQVNFRTSAAGVCYMYVLCMYHFI